MMSGTTAHGRELTLDAHAARRRSFAASRTAHVVMRVTQSSRALVRPHLLCARLNPDGRLLGSLPMRGWKSLNWLAVAYRCHQKMFYTQLLSAAPSAEPGLPPVRKIVVGQCAPSDREQCSVQASRSARSAAAGQDASAARAWRCATGRTWPTSAPRWPTGTGCARTATRRNTPRRCDSLGIISPMLALGRELYRAYPQGMFCTPACSIAQVGQRPDLTRYLLGRSDEGHSTAARRAGFATPASA